MRILGLADGRPSPVDGHYLVRMDVEARNGRGMLVATEDPAKAMVFDGMPQLASYWRRPSQSVPYRPDGKENRPLTAYTVEAEQV